MDSGKYMQAAHLQYTYNQLYKQSTVLDSLFNVQTSSDTSTSYLTDHELMTNNLTHPLRTMGTSALM